MYKFILNNLKSSFVSFFFTGLIDEDAMNNLPEILRVIFIGLVVATFLVNSGRELKAAEVCKEFLIVLDSGVLKTEGFLLT